jgi:hypothetical protein
VKVTSLFVKRKYGSPMDPVTTWSFDQYGIAEGVLCARFRQVLIAARSIIADCGLRPGDLRENVIIDYDDLYDLPSGTVIRIGTALIRLTFHCEPCKKILKLVEFNRIEHRRGVFGTFLNAGRVSTGDTFAITEQKFEPIPYDSRERIRWFLSRHKTPIAPIQLINELGLPSSYARAIPGFVRKLMMATSIEGRASTADASSV